MGCGSSTDVNPVEPSFRQPVSARSTGSIKSGNSSNHRKSTSPSPLAPQNDRAANPLAEVSEQIDETKCKTNPNTTAPLPTSCGESLLQSHATNSPMKSVTSPTMLNTEMIEEPSQKTLDASNASVLDDTAKSSAIGNDTNTSTEGHPEQSPSEHKSSGGTESPLVESFAGEVNSRPALDNNEDGNTAVATTEEPVHEKPCTDDTVDVDEEPKVNDPSVIEPVEHPSESSEHDVAQPEEFTKSVEVNESSEMSLPNDTAVIDSLVAGEHFSTNDDKEITGDVLSLPQTIDPATGEVDAVIPTENNLPDPAERSNVGE